MIPTELTVLVQSPINENVEANGYTNVVLEQKAVSNRAGTTKLFICDWSKGMNRIFKSQCANDRSVEVELVTIDDYFDGIDEQIDFIKMDIEGSEDDAVRGMSSLIKRNQDLTILTEFNPAPISEFGIQPIDYLSHLMNDGFDLYEMVEGAHGIEAADVESLLNRFTVENEQYTNLVCIKST